MSRSSHKGNCSWPGGLADHGSWVIMDALERTHGHKARPAKLHGVTRLRLYGRVKRPSTSPANSRRPGVAIRRAAPRRSTLRPGLLGAREFQPHRACVRVVRRRPMHAIQVRSAARQGEKVMAGRLGQEHLITADG